IRETEIRRSECALDPDVLEHSRRRTDREGTRVEWRRVDRSVGSGPHQLAGRRVSSVDAGDDVDGLLAARRDRDNARRFIVAARRAKRRDERIATGEHLRPEVARADTRVGWWLNQRFRNSARGGNAVQAVARRPIIQLPIRRPIQSAATGRVHDDPWHASFDRNDSYLAVGQPLERHLPSVGRENRQHTTFGAVNRGCVKLVEPTRPELMTIAGGRPPVDEDGSIAGKDKAVPLRRSLDVLSRWKGNHRPEYAIVSARTPQP